MICENHGGIFLMKFVMMIIDFKNFKMSVEIIGMIEFVAY